MTYETSLRVFVLGSGSSGNATLVTNGRTTVLVDCGFSAREVSRRMSAVGISPDSVAALLVTHEHGDHVRGVDVFTRRHAPGCRVLGSPGTVDSGPMAAARERCEVVRHGEEVSIGSLTIRAFRTSHDAAQPFGFRIASNGCAFGLATDTGVLTPETAEALRGCDLIGIECNHDIDMLENGPYPYHLKRRIRSSLGHLSNNDAADALETLASDRLRRVVAMHRSRTNNTSTLAARALEHRLMRLDLRVPVHVAAQSEWLEVS